MIVVKPGGPCNSITGSASGLGTPKLANEGPIPRRSTCLGALPVMMNPPMATLLPVRTRMRVERLRACAGGAALGLGVGVGASVAVAVAVAVAVGEGVQKGGHPSLGVGVGVCGVGVAVGVGVPGVTDALGVGVAPPHGPLSLNWNVSIPM